MNGLQSMGDAQGAQMEEKYFAAHDGTRIAYHTIGEGPPLMLANGLGGTYIAWRHLYSYFRDRFRIITWDYRATYHSSPPTNLEHLRIEDHVKDALMLCEKEAVTHAIWAGWSMGVQLSLEIYRHAPDLFRALILINGTPGNIFDTAFDWKGSSLILPACATMATRLALPVSLAGRALVQWKGLIGLMKRIGLVGATLDEDIFRDLAREFASLDVKNYMTIFRSLGEHSTRDILPTVGVPVLVIAGERDPFTPRRQAEKMVRKLPDAELCVVPGGTHYAPVEYPELVNLRIEKFLRERQLAGKAGGKSKECSSVH